VEPIVLQIPDSLKSIVAPLESLIRLLSEQIAASSAASPAGFAPFERALSERTAELERSAYVPVLAALDVDTHEVRIGGVLHRRVGRFAAPFRTLAGEVSITRSLFRPSGAGSSPTVDVVALRAGTLGERWLPHAASAMAFLGQQGTSREAVQTAAQLGRLPYPRASFETILHGVGAQWARDHADVEQALIEAYEVPAAARSVSVSLDRVSVRMEEPRKRGPGRPPKGGPKRLIVCAWRMAYCATVTLHDEKGEALHTIRYGRMPQGDATKLVESLCDDVMAMLRARPELRVALLCDGASEMWNLLSAQINDTTLKTKVWELVDYWHTAEKLGRAAQARHPESAAEGSKLLARWKTLLLERPDGAERIAAEIASWDVPTPPKDTSCPLHDARTYLAHHASRMLYAQARAAGLPIGSGNVEATCKCLVEVRMKRPGARWHEDTGEHVLQLRALALSDRWSPALSRLLAVNDVVIEPVTLAA